MIYSVSSLIKFFRQNNKIILFLFTINNTNKPNFLKLQIIELRLLILVQVSVTEFSLRFSSRLKKPYYIVSFHLFSFTNQLTPIIKFTTIWIITSGFEKIGVFNLCYLFN